MSIGNPLEFLRQLDDLTVDRTISPDDTMSDGYDRHYFGVGRSAIIVIAAAMIGRLSYRGGDQQVTTILDCGSGYGRVSRYLKAAFPQSRVEVTDYDPNGPLWCEQRLGCHVMASPMPTNHYDLIWLGSVFTHLSELMARELLTSVVAALKPSGLLVFTTGGRLGADHIRGHLNRKVDERYNGYNMQDAEIEQILQGFDQGDYGYADYHNQTGYGSALSRPAWWHRELSKGDLIQCSFQECAWDTHQDVYGYLKFEGSLVGFTNDKGPYF